MWTACAGQLSELQQEALKQALEAESWFACVRACKLPKRTEPRNIRDKARPFGRVFLKSSAWIAPTFCWHSCHEHWTILIFLSSETKNRTELDFKEKRRDYYE